MWAIFALGTMEQDAEPAVGALARMLLDKDDYCQVFAAHALAALGPSAYAARAALESVRTNDYATRLLVQWVLAEIPASTGK